MLRKLKILVVEHDLTTLRQMEQLLGAKGAEPRCVASAAQVDELINKEKFDGVILDWDLPEGEGRALTQRIRKSRSNSKVPLAILSEQPSARALAEGFESGANFFLSKPIGPTELSRLLNASRAAMIEERRSYQRAPLAVSVTCTWEKKRAVGKTINISASGLLLRLSKYPEPGSAVRLEFALPPSRQRLELEALVARTAPDNQVGVKFIEVPREQRELLMAYTDRTIGTRLPL